MARRLAEMATYLIAAVLLACAVCATQPWLDRHFLPSFLFPRDWYVRLETAVRFGLAIAGALLLRWAPRLGQLAGRAPSGSVRIALAALLALGISEPVLRGMHLQPNQWLRADEEPLRRADERLGWTLAPARTGHATIGGRTVDYAVDVAGYRVRDATHAVDVTRPSVLFIGESVMFGEGLTWPETVPARVEDALGLQSANLAVHGYGSDQAFLRLQTELPRFREPRAVVTLFTPSLFGRNLDRQRPHLESGLVWVAPRPAWQLQTLARLVVPYHSDRVIAEGIATTRQILQATAALARSRGAVPLVLLPQFGAEDPPQQSIRRRVLDGSGVDYAFVQIDPSWRLPWDRHPDARAAGVLAAAVVARLRPALRR